MRAALDVGQHRWQVGVRQAEVVEPVPQPPQSPRQVRPLRRRLVGHLAARAPLPVDPQELRAAPIELLDQNVPRRTLEDADQFEVAREGMAPMNPTAAGLPVELPAEMVALGLGVLHH